MSLDVPSSELPFSGFLCCLVLTFFNHLFLGLTFGAWGGGAYFSPYLNFLA